MVLRVKPTPTRFPTNSRYTPMDSTLLHFTSSALTFEYQLIGGCACLRCRSVVGIEGYALIDAREA